MFLDLLVHWNMFWSSFSHVHHAQIWMESFIILVSMALLYFCCCYFNFKGKNSFLELQESQIHFLLTNFYCCYSNHQRAFVSWHPKENMKKQKNFSRKFLKKTKETFLLGNLSFMKIQRCDDSSSFSFFAFFLNFLTLWLENVWTFFNRVSASMEVFLVCSDVDIGNRLDFYGSYGKNIFIKILNCRIQFNHSEIYVFNCFIFFKGFPRISISMEYLCWRLHSFPAPTNVTVIILYLQPNLINILIAQHVLMYLQHLHIYILFTLQSPPPRSKTKNEESVLFLFLFWFWSCRNLYVFSSLVTRPLK